jgi:hypothetical protein
MKQGILPWRSISVCILMAPYKSLLNDDTLP